LVKGTDLIIDELAVSGQPVL